MPPKDKKDIKKELKTPTEKSSTFGYGESDDTYTTPRNISLSLFLEGDVPSPGEWTFLVIFNGQVILDRKWENGLLIQNEALPLNLKEPYYQVMAADKPLIFILRALGGKGAKDPDPLLNLDNRAGGTVDLLPLLLGEEEIFVKVPLNTINEGEKTGCCIEVYATASGTSENTKVPLTITILSAHCLPHAKEGTVYIAAIGLDGGLDHNGVNFGMSLSFSAAKKVMWAAASAVGHGANTAHNVPNQDIYISEDLTLQSDDHCRSSYWNAMKRILIEPTILIEKLTSPFLLEMAGVPKLGKIDIRGRYMAFIDAGVLLEAGQYGVTVSAKLLVYNEADLPEGVGALLELPPTSAKASARDSSFLMDEHGHNAYVLMRFDLMEPLVPKAKMASLFDTIGFSPPEGVDIPIDDLEVEPPPEDTLIDARRIRKQADALAVHRELSELACRGAVPMNQGIKRTAANRLLMRVRSMLKQFPPGDCYLIDWQEIVSGQHTASRRAVTSSFAPQYPPLRPPSRFAAARSRIAGDTRIANEHIKVNLTVAGGHPRSLLSKVLRCLEERNDTDARNYLLEGLSAQTWNRYLLWTFGAQEFDKGFESIEAASAAFRIAVKGNYSDGTANAIGWAALHAFYHSLEKPYAAFVAAQKMRKSYELPKEWKKFLQRWTDISGEEEVFWMPSVVTSDNPMLIASAFFLCLRCYKFSERLLLCVEQGCATRGCRRGAKTNLGSDVYYLRASSLLLRRQLDKALEMTMQGIKKYGPSAIMSQMRASCLVCTRGWDGECERALNEADRAGSDPCPAILLQGALGGLTTNPRVSLQRAARAHKIAPSAHSALIIGRVYVELGNEALAERWAAVAVKSEPLLADGWAVLALLAMYERNLNKAKVMLRTARQVGPVSQDIEEEVKAVMEIVQLETLPDSLAKNLCFCDYY